MTTDPPSTLVTMSSSWFTSWPIHMTHSPDSMMRHGLSCTWMGRGQLRRWGGWWGRLTIWDALYDIVLIVFSNDPMDLFHECITPPHTKASTNIDSHTPIHTHTHTRTHTHTHTHITHTHTYTYTHTHTHKQTNTHTRTHTHTHTHTRFQKDSCTETVCAS